MTGRCDRCGSGGREVNYCGFAGTNERICRACYGKILDERGASRPAVNEPPPAHASGCARCGHDEDRHTGILGCDEDGPSAGGLCACLEFVRSAQERVNA